MSSPARSLRPRTRGQPPRPHGRSRRPQSVRRPSSLAMFATARIEQQPEKVPAVPVPTSAVLTQTGTSRVYVVNGDKAHRTTGQQLDTLIEIATGLKAGGEGGDQERRATPSTARRCHNAVASFALAAAGLCQRLILPSRSLACSRSRSWASTSSRSTSRASSSPRCSRVRHPSR